MVFLPGNELVVDLAFTPCVPVVYLGSNKQTCQMQNSYRKSLGK
jgi:hypothetical protein